MLHSGRSAGPYDSAVTGPKTTAISHFGAMDPARFAVEYLRPAVPVVLSGAVDGWPAIAKWSHSWFADAFGDRRVHVSFGGPLDGRREAVALGDYLRHIAEPAAGYLRL